METEIKEITIDGYRCSDSTRFNELMEEIETLGVQQQYSLYIQSLKDKRKFK